MMSHPIRRYCFHLAEKLGKSVQEVEQFDMATIREWMAFDMTRDPEWTKKYEKEQELIKQKKASASDRARMFHEFFRGK